MNSNKRGNDQYSNGCIDNAFILCHATDKNNRRICCWIPPGISFWNVHNISKASLFGASASHIVIDTESLIIRRWIPAHNGVTDVEHTKLWTDEQFNTFCTENFYQIYWFIATTECYLGMEDYIHDPGMFIITKIIFRLESAVVGIGERIHNMN